MSSEIRVKQGTAICWADSTDYNDANSGIPRTHQLDLTGLSYTGTARQGEKADLGAARAPGYAVLLGVETDIAPDAGDVIEVYWSASYSATASVGNMGGASGEDEAFRTSTDADEFIKQLIHIGDLVFTDDSEPVVQMQCVNPCFSPPTRYGQPVVFNESRTLQTDADEMFLAFIPIVDEVQ